MISKTIGYNGVHNIFRQTHVSIIIYPGIFYIYYIIIVIINPLLCMDQGYGGKKDRLWVSDKFQPQVSSQDGHEETSILNHQQVVSL